MDAEQGRPHSDGTRAMTRSSHRHHPRLFTHMAPAVLLAAMLAAIEQAEGDLRASYAKKLGPVLPAKKVARYLQIENKIRGLVKYDLATGVPLVQ